MSDEESNLSPIVKVVTSETPPTFLHHYTSLETLVAIAKSATLRASEIRYMNDAEEFRLFADKLAQSVRDIELEIPETEEVTKARNQFLEWIGHHLMDEYAQLVFVISLSEEPNLLSQWRSYTSLNQGVSIGFDSSQIVGLGNDQGFRLARCVYDDRAQKNFCEVIAKYTLQNAIERGPSKLVATGFEYFESFNEVEDDIVMIGSIFKHRAFIEEKEWRLISTRNYGSEDAGISHRTGTTAIIPYKDFSLATKSHARPVRRIFVGPSVNERLSRRSIQHLMENTNIGHEPTAIANCGIPLRAV